MKIDFIKAMVRFDDKLNEGFFELTMNQNYYTERKVRDINVKMISEKISGIAIKRAEYFGFKDVEEVGFLFSGSNLDENKLKLFF
jgi:hypothetical protein